MNWHHPKLRRRAVWPEQPPSTELLEGTIVHTSSFTAPDGTSVNDYVPELGAAFAALVGAGEIMGNQLRPLGPPLIATVHLGISDVQVQVGAFLGADAGAEGGAVFRLVDASHYWLAYLGTQGHGGLRLRGGPGGDSETTFPFTVNPAGHQLLVQAVGANLQVWVDGFLVLAGLSSVHQSATKHGLWVADGGAGGGRLATEFMLSVP